MRVRSISAVLMGAVLLSGCAMAVPVVPVQPVPGRPAVPVVVAPAVPAAPVVVAPVVPDTTVARQVVRVELAHTPALPNRAVASATECVMQNASMAELADIAAMQGRPGARNAVAAIVQRPATRRCIAGSVV